MLGVWSCWLAGMDPRWILICIEVLSFGMVWSFFAWFQGLNSLKWRGVCVLLTVAHFCIMAIRVEQPFLITENFRIIHHQNSSRSEKHHVATYEDRVFCSVHSGGRTIVWIKIGHPRGPCSGRIRR